MAINKMLNKIWNNKIFGILPASLLCISIIYKKLYDKISTYLFLANVKKHGKNIKICRGITYRYPQNIIINNNCIVGCNTSFQTELNE